MKHYSPQGDNTTLVKYAHKVQSLFSLLIEEKKIKLYTLLLGRGPKLILFPVPALL